jgi:hypothetical protein
MPAAFYIPTKNPGQEKGMLVCLNMEGTEIGHDVTHLFLMSISLLIQNYTVELICAVEN